MGQQKRFTKEFEDEAVRLALTSGRTRRSVAEDLGVGLSTLTRWIGRDRDRKPDPSCGSELAVSSPDTQVTVCSYEMGDNLGPNGLSSGCKVFCSRSMYPRS